MPKVSVITPIYCDTSQKVDWLGEAIESVLKQTLTDWEMILINDKSPVPLGAIRSKYNDPRLRWFDNAKNYGTARTRNTAVALAESDCILPLDSDDLLGDEETLEVMYDAWIMDKTKIIYGNIQFMQDKSGKVLQLAPYSFDNVMDLRGALPVTCMHSVACHQNAIAEVEPGKYMSGWKPILEHGREDVEYWIAAGKRGYCGLKIDHTTLIYRRHRQSRDYRLKVNNQLEAAQRLIKALHKDVYGGKYPMACCGKGGSTQANTPVLDPLTISRRASQKEVKHITTLEGYPEKDLEWVAYQGPKTGRGGDVYPRGPAGTPIKYAIHGKGHFFQIHKAHRRLFEDRQRLGFEMNQPDPRIEVEEKPAPPPRIDPQPAPVVPAEQANPELSVIERIDSVAAQTRQIEVRGPVQGEVIIEPSPPPAVSYKMSATHPNVLGLGNSLTETLDGVGYTVEELATATPKMLSSLPGIGMKRANTIIAKAQEYLKK